ncbi:nitrate- and nitrite sensing domain-containing protein [Klebsiella pneumoniae subsp. pneumoniae]|nr:nitrate- and nitrite sensing domain-containing protein [Klebsiella pneumoniae subsp. pneumoniae]
MLQCERGASNIYLCSGGLLYTAECRAGGALVDERLALFYASLERARAVAGSALCWRIARAVDELAQLPALRAQIGRRQIAAGSRDGAVQPRHPPSAEHRPAAQ